MRVVRGTITRAPWSFHFAKSVSAPEIETSVLAGRSPRLSASVWTAGERRYFSNWSPAFFSAAGALRAGETSRPFETAFGWHIARAVEDARVVAPEFDDVRGVLAAETRRDAEAKLLERLRGERPVVLVFLRHFG